MHFLIFLKKPTDLKLLNIMIFISLLTLHAWRTSEQLLKIGNICLLGQQLIYTKLKISYY
jgi:hypothetical protein